MRTSRAADFCIGLVNFISTTDGKTAANLMDMRLVVQKVKAQRIGRAPLRTIILVDEAGTTHARGNPCPFGATIMQSLTK